MKKKEAARLNKKEKNVGERKEQESKQSDYKKK